MRALASMAKTETLRQRTMGHAVCTYAVHRTACSCIDGDSLGLFARAEARDLTVKAKRLGPALSRWHTCLPHDPMRPKTSTVAASDVPEDRRHRHGTPNRLPAEATQPASAGCCRTGQRWSAHRFRVPLFRRHREAVARSIWGTCCIAIQDGITFVSLYVMGSDLSEPRFGPMSSSASQNETDSCGSMKRYAPSCSDEFSGYSG